MKIGYLFTIVLLIALFNAMAQSEPHEGRRARFDGGGELGNCIAVHDLFCQAGYEVEVTAPNSSSEIGQAERPHRTIADGVRTMLFSAGLEPKYWP